MCCDTDEEVTYHTASMKVSRLNMVRGIRSGILPARRSDWSTSFTPEEVGVPGAAVSQCAIQGTARPRARAASNELAARYGTRDLGVVTICYDFAARVRSYELVAEVCGLP